MHRIGNVPRLPFCLLLLLMCGLWIAGGASRADVLGQPIVRSLAVGVLVPAILLVGRPSLSKLRFVAFLMFAALMLPLWQLIPLPPIVWEALPGRRPFTLAAELSGQEQPWRPLSIVPSGTTNAAGSLLVPFVVLIIAAQLRARERASLVGFLLFLISASAFVGLLQLSGAGLDNPLMNQSVGQISGTFANRNHFALFLAMGCVLAPTWAFLEGRRPAWRSLLALGLVLFFALTILVSGSRAGMLVGLMATGTGFLLAWQGIRRELRRAPRWALPVLLTSLVGTLVIFVAISVAADRAESITRAFDMDVGQDMRSRGLPTVLKVLSLYFPVGAGFGGFEPMFRMHEPMNLLKVSYFNHAHNDFLEVVIDGGLPALILIAVSLIWWGWASIRVWRGGTDGNYTLPRLGSAVLLLIIVASLFDYPARTPTIMAMVVIAAVWLSSGASVDEQSPLPERRQHL